MPSKKTTTKSTRSKSTSSGSAKSSQAGPNGPGVLQVDDPIIIKGGSISLSFDQHNFEDVTSSTSDKNKKFNHGFNPALKMLKIFSGGSITSIVLKPGDAIKICYQGSRCDDTLP
jgi:hypothetical protein